MGVPLILSEFQGCDPSHTPPPPQGLCTYATGGLASCQLQRWVLLLGHIVQTQLPGMVLLVVYRRIPHPPGLPRTVHSNTETSWEICAVWHTWLCPWLVEHYGRSLREERGVSYEGEIPLFHQCSSTSNST